MSLIEGGARPSAQLIGYGLIYGCAWQLSDRLTWPLTGIRVVIHSYHRLVSYN